MEWMTLPLLRYADFSGRSQRMEYWMYALGHFIVMVAGFCLYLADHQIGGWLLGAILLAGLIPTLAVQVRRLHDTNRSGFWLLLYFVPFGSIVLLVFMCLDGTQGYNHYGDDPKGRARYLGEVFA
jgi:uncharacterized membrane protein YhaH (DUF805 family)